jgi:hypothetical protein
LVKLDYPFDVANEELLRVSATPQNGEEVLGVVGFPADKRSGRMYEAWQNASWGNIISHRIPTFRGMDHQQVLLIGQG